MQRGAEGRTDEISGLCCADAGARWQRGRAAAAAAAADSPKPDSQIRWW
eukprot:SAG31_NODE_42472_length_271_cov_0.906977_1_plen_48_part_10